MGVEAPILRKVEPALESDIPAIVDIYFTAWDSARLREIFPPTESGRGWVHEAFRSQLAPRKEGGPDTKLLVTKNAEGESAVAPSGGL